MRTIVFSLFLFPVLLTACGQEEATPTDSLSETGDAQVTSNSSEPAMDGSGEEARSVATDVSSGIEKALAGDHRDPEAAARDKYRHPGETLKFFGLEPDMTVVELWPGGSGWYTAVLAPVLKGEGQLIAASYSPDAESEYYQKSEARYREKLDAHPEVYGEIDLVTFLPPAQTELGEPGSVDLVLTFRNLHNWHEQDVLRQVFESAYEVLKPGGTFGVVEHRAAEGVSIEEAAGSGYMPPDYVIQLAEDVGFTLEAESEINANPKDTADHPEGVWTLPPGLQLCNDMEDGEEKTACIEKYSAIGESDRMTLKFVKPTTQ